MDNTLEKLPLYLAIGPVRPGWGTAQAWKQQHGGLPQKADTAS
jgi:hypothetical protein